MSDQKEPISLDGASQVLSAQRSEEGRGRWGSFGRQLEQAPRLLLVLSSLGFLLSLGLEYIHWATYLRPTSDSFCSLGQALDCAAVAASKYSVAFGLPWAVWGALGFLAIMIAVIRRSVWLLPLSLLGGLASVVLLALSLFAVHSVCVLCEIAHLLSWLICGLAFKQARHLSGTWRDTSTLLDITVAPAGLAVALLVFLPRYWDAFSFKGEPPFATGHTEQGEAWIGAVDPKITLHEYVDYSCGHCKVHSMQTLRALRNHPEVRVVRRHQPRMRCLPSLPGSCSYLRMAFCAEDQGKFWQADRWLFAHARPGLNEPDVKRMAADLQLSEQELSKCVASAQVFERAARASKAASKERILSVPAYKLDGKRLKPAQVKELLD